MKPIVLNFIGGYWDGRSLRNDSPEQEEVFLAAGCYEMSHHGSVGAEFVGLTDDAVEFAQSHGWEAKTESAGTEDAHRYLVSERRETETEIIITFKHIPNEKARQA